MVKIKCDKNQPYPYLCSVAGTLWATGRPPLRWNCGNAMRVTPVIDI